MQTQLIEVKTYENNLEKRAMFFLCEQFLQTKIFVRIVIKEGEGTSEPRHCSLAPSIDVGCKLQLVANN